MRYLLFLVLFLPCVVLAQPPVVEDSASEPLSEQPAGDSVNNTNEQNQISISLPIDDSGDAPAPQQSTDEGNGQREIEAECESCLIASQDLIEQSRMADATINMADDTGMQVTISRQGLWISGVGLGLLFFALLLNWKATRAATKAANAGIDQVKNNRALITPKIKPNFWFATQGGRTIAIDVIVDWQNSGETPASDVKVLRGHSIDDEELGHDAIPFPAYSRNNPMAFSAGILGKGQEWPVEDRIKRRDINRMIRGEVQIYIFMVAYFTSVHKEKCETKIMFEIKFIGEEAQADRPLLDKNSFVIHPVGRHCSTSYEEE